MAARRSLGPRRPRGRRLVGSEDPWLCVTSFDWFCLCRSEDSALLAGAVNSGMYLKWRQSKGRWTNGSFGSLADILAHFPRMAALGRLADISWTGFLRSDLNVRSHPKQWSSGATLAQRRLPGAIQTCPGADSRRLGPKVCSCQEWPFTGTESGQNE
jgi:hypothetical protein